MHAGASGAAFEGVRDGLSRGDELVGNKAIDNRDHCLTDLLTIVERPCVSSLSIPVGLLPSSCGLEKSRELH